MKKFVSRILSLGLALTAATAAAEADMPAETTKALSVGSVTVYDFGDIKLHAYNMGYRMEQKAVRMHKITKTDRQSAQN